MIDNAATMALMVAGKLSQTCPAACREGWRRTHPGPEAAGYRCSACGVPTRQPAWHMPERSPARIAASARLGARSSKETGLSPIVEGDAS